MGPDAMIFIFWMLSFKPTFSLSTFTGTQTEPKPCLRLEPRGWDWKPAKSHGTWFQDLMKLRFLMSHRRKNSVRNKLIGRSGLIQIETEAHYTECRPSQRASSVQFSSVAQLCLTLCDPMNCSTPGLPVHHQLPQFTQTHVHRVSDAIQPSHPLRVHPRNLAWLVFIGWVISHANEWEDYSYYFG